MYMKNINKIGIICLWIIFLQTVFCSMCPAAVLTEKGLKIKKSVEEGEIITAKIMIKEAHGGPQVNNLQTNYPPSTELMVSASLTAQKGFYQVELLSNGKTSLTITAENGKTVKDSGEISVDKSGSIQYRVLAQKAKDIILDLSFSPVAVQKEIRPNTVSSSEKMSGSREGLNLSMICTAGKNCILKLQNTNKSEAYKNILFQVDYNMMVEEGTMEKIKRGIIEDTILPEKTGEWSIGLVFGEPPRIVKIKLISANAVDPATVSGADQNKPKKTVILNVVSERQLTK